MVEEIEFIAEIEKLYKSSVIRRLLNKVIPEWKLDHALKSYQDKKISIGKAAELSSISILEFMEKLSQHKISINYDLEDLENDLKTVKGL